MRLGFGCGLGGVVGVLTDPVQQWLKAGDLVRLLADVQLGQHARGSATSRWRRPLSRRARCTGRGRASSDAPWRDARLRRQETGRSVVQSWMNGSHVTPPAGEGNRVPKVPREVPCLIASHPAYRHTRCWRHRRKSAAGPRQLQEGSNCPTQPRIQGKAAKCNVQPHRTINRVAATRNVEDARRVSLSRSRSSSATSGMAASSASSGVIAVPHLEQRKTVIPSF